MAAADNDTFDGAMITLITQLGKMKLLADADLPFVVELETKILEKARSPMRKLQSMGLLPSGGGDPMAAQGGMPPGGPMPGPMPPGPPGGPPMPPMPDMGMGGMSAPPPSFMGAGAPPGVNQSPNMPPEEIMPMMA